MNRDVIPWLAWAASIVVVALVARYLRELGHIDHETTTRLVIGLNGLLVAWAGNRMPKAMAPNARVQQVRRVGGWSMALSGLVYAGLWAFAPIALAKVAGTVVIALGILVTVAYCLSLRSRAHAA